MSSAKSLNLGIIKRELLESMKSMRFIVLLLFSICLFSLNSVVFVKRITKQVDSYSDKISKEKVRSTYGTIIYKKPCILQFITEGGDKNQPEGYTLYPGGWIEPSHLTSSTINDKMPDVPDIDWTFIVKIVFSLYVLLLGYDAISGEKERGTLRLMLSNPLNRIGVLTSKYLSIGISVIIPLVFGMLISLTVVLSSISQIVSLNTVISIVMFNVISFLYLSVFVFLSLLFSSLIHQSSVVLLSLLSIWIVWLVIPEVSFIVSRELSNVPGEYQIMRQLNSRDSNDTGLIDLNRRIKIGDFKSEEEVKFTGSQMLEKLENDLHKFYVNYQNSMILKSINARIFARFSPMALFQYSAENIAGTGLNEQNRFVSGIKAYSPVYDRYILEKVGKIVGVRKFHRGWLVRFQDKPIEIDSPQPEQYQGDMSDFPLFYPSNHSIVQKMRDMSNDLIGLLFWNIILSISCFVVFEKCDIR